MDAVYMIDIAVVSEPPEGFMSDDVEARFEVYSTTAFDMTGKAVLDIGATATVGSLEALEALMQVKASRGEHETVKVYPDCRRKFRFGNGEVAESLSYIEIPQRLDGKLIYLGIHTMDTSNVPILLSIKTLKKLGAIIDIGRRLVIFQFFKPLIRLSQCGSRNHPRANFFLTSHRIGWQLLCPLRIVRVWMRQDPMCLLLRSNMCL